MVIKQSANQCPNCRKQFEVPKGICYICFGNVLGDINDIEDKEERFEKLNDWINELSAFEYERGLHNASGCPIEIDADGSGLEEGDVDS